MECLLHQTTVQQALVHGVEGIHLLLGQRARLDQRGQGDHLLFLTAARFPGFSIMVSCPWYHAPG